jgi:ArsR family transcriptional regulator, lead/cadmium/zinc/bismuth-responsive transcriptional repressor
VHQVPTSRRDERIVDPDQVCDALAVLADRPAVRRSAAVLGALGDPSRLSLLLALHHAGDLCVSDLAFAVGMTDSAVSHALRLLRAHGMVTAHRAGRMVHYRVAGELTSRLLDIVSAEAVGDIELHGRGAGHTA